MISRFSSLALLLSIVLIGEYANSYSTPNPHRIRDAITNGYTTTNNRSNTTAYGNTRSYCYS